MSNPLPLFNIAAIPATELHPVFFDAASQFAPYATKYCLKPEAALPHVTLCQFRAPDIAAALSLTQNDRGKTLPLKATSLYIKKRENSFTIGHIIERSALLMALQASLIDHLRQTATEILTGKGDDYFPHVTLARINRLPTLASSFFLQAETPLPCKLRLGLSDENGQFLKCLDGPL